MSANKRWTRPNFVQFLSGVFHGCSFRLTPLEYILLDQTPLQMSGAERANFLIQRAALASIQRQVGGRISILSLNDRHRLPQINQVPGSHVIAQFYLSLPKWKSRAEVHAFDGRLVTLEFSRSVKNVSLDGMSISSANARRRSPSAAEVIDRYEHGRQA